MKKNILIINGFYTPSVKAGGPIQSIKNIVENYSDHYNFHIVTSDRDLGDSEPFPNCKTDTWHHFGNAKVLYTDTSQLSIKKLTRIINSSECDVVYLNSYFSYKYSILPIVLKKINFVNFEKIVLAPRGEFSEGAIKQKKFKKQLFLKIANILKFHKNITFHATNNLEEDLIESNVKSARDIIVANNLTANYDELKNEKKLRKDPGKVDLVFISRIHPKKNLHFALECLKDLDGLVNFNIYGPVEDKKYWGKCQSIIKSLPNNITVKYHGVSKREQIMRIFHSNHFFFFPTLGENYGHVIAESLIGGCPVLISDQTPWLDLKEKGIGWNLALNSKENFKDILKHIINMGDNDYQRLSKASFDYAKNNSNNERERANYLSLFNQYK